VGQVIDDLSEDELEHINDSKGRCPACKKGDLVAGPAGGSSYNYRCKKCKQEYNLAINRVGRGPYIWFGEKLDRKDASLYTGATLSKEWGKEVFDGAKDRKEK